MKKRKNLFYGLLGISLAVLMTSALYLDEMKKQDEAEPVFQNSDVLNLPLIDKTEELIEVPMKVNAKKVVEYFDSAKSEAELMNAVTEFEGVWRPSQSVCYSLSGKVFEVTAMVSGVVKEVYQDELMGKCVDVDCGYGLVISYQSLSSSNVEKGQQVEQFDVIGLAGENSYHSDLGIHAQITVHLNGELMDPEDLIHMKITDLN